MQIFFEVEMQKLESENEIRKKREKAKKMDVTELINVQYTFVH